MITNFQSSPDYLRTILQMVFSSQAKNAGVFHDQIKNTE